MAELKRIEDEVPAAGLATYGIPPKQTEGPKLVKGQEAETLDRGTAVSEPMALFSEPEMGDHEVAAFQSCTSTFKADR